MKNYKRLSEKIRKTNIRSKRKVQKHEGSTPTRLYNANICLER